MNDSNVFISYASRQEDVVLRRRVRQLADSLRMHGVHVQLDQYLDDAPDEGWPRWCERCIEEATHVLLVCTETYVRRANSREHRDVHGAAWEAHIIYQELYDSNVCHRKFIPILFDDDDQQYIPMPLRATTRYTVDGPTGYRELYRRLTGQYTPAPPVGDIIALAEEADPHPLFPAPDLSQSDEAEKPEVFPQRLGPHGTGAGGSINRIARAGEHQAKEETSQYWDVSKSESGHGWFREARKKNAGDRTLVVLIHGLLGDCDASWREVPPWLIKLLGRDVSIYSFGYPAKTLQSADLDPPAKELRYRLSQARMERYRDLFFLVHSAGGLVVKKMLLEDEHALQSPDGVDLFNRSLIAYRTRRIINLAVPHAGASWTSVIAYTLASPVLIPLGGALHAWSHLASFLEWPGQSLGINRIPLQLAWGRETLRRDEERFRALRDRLERFGLPFINAPDLTGTNDRAIWRFRLRAVSQLEKRSSRSSVRSHSGVKSDPAVIDEVVEHIIEGGDPVINGLMDATMFLSGEVDRGFEVHALVEADHEAPSGYHHDPRRTVDGSWIGSQAEVRDELLRRVRSTAHEDRRILVTGAAGVGKSATVRDAARRLASSVLASGAVESCIPIVMPLYRYGSSLIASPGNVLNWATFSSWWCDWIEAEIRRVLSTRGWNATSIEAWPYIKPSVLQKLLNERRCVLVLDGVDDFLIRHPTLSSLDIGLFVREIEKSHPAENVTVVLGMRSSLSMGELVAQPHVLEIGRLTHQQARGFCRARGEDAVATLNRLIGDCRLSGLTLELLLTPLILSKLIVLSDASVVSTLLPTPIAGDARPLSAARVFQQTLLVHLRQSGLLEIEFDRLYSESNWVDALTIVGFTAFSRHWGSWSVDQMIDAVSEVIETWRNAGTTKKAELEERIAGFELATREECLSALFKRSLFFAGTAVRFEHREWEEFLAARHNALAIEFENISALSRRGSWTRMHFLTRDLLSEDDPHAEFSQDFVQEVIDSGRTQRIQDPANFKAQIPVGNLLGIVGHSRRPIRPMVFDLLLNEYLGQPRSMIPALVEVVAMQTLGFRAIAGAEFDAGLRESFVEALISGYRDVRSAGETSSPLVQQSAAWWLEALAPAEERDAIVRHEDEEALLVDARSFISHETADGKIATHKLDETMQRVLLNMQVELLHDAGKIIPCATYLLMLVAADQAGVLVPDARIGLHRILGSGELACAISNEISEKCPVRGVIEVWQQCRIRYE